MSDAAGKENPAFANEEDECGSKLENGGQQQATLDQDRKSSTDGASLENGHQRSFISQHYVEPIKPSSEPCYKTETRIELPADNTEKNVSEPKLNGVHGNGNNNDASFLNNSATSAQVNESGKKEQIEAVNLELVSMRPYTGNNIQTKGQEACEVPADPYEEYFVPVNEHRKYIRGPEAEVETTVAGVRFDLGPGVGREGLSLRDPAAGLVDYSHWLTALRGEKLYVTKDKRSRNSYWRRMAWGCALFVVVIAIIIAILAATGVIPTQEATEPLKNVEESNTHQTKDVHTAGSQEYVKNPPSSPSPFTSTFPPWPTTDETLYRVVPDALNGILRLDDLNWSDDLSDVKSRMYRKVSTEIEEHLGNILQLPDSRSIIKVYDINQEGEIKFRIGYPPMDNVTEIQEHIENALQQNSSMIGQYHVNRLHVGKLIDQCEHGNLGCSASCKYIYSTSTFVCTCSAGKMLDQDGKTCIDDSDLSNVEIDETTPQSSTESVQVVGEARSRDPAKFEFRHSNTQENLDFKTESTEMDTSTVEPKMEHVQPHTEQGSSVEQTESTLTTKHDNDHHSIHEQSHHSTETITELESSSVKTLPTAEPTVQSFTNSTIEQEASAEPEPTTEPEPAAEPEPTAKPEPSAEPEPTTEPEAIAETESISQPKLIIESDSTTVLSVSTQELNAEPKPDIQGFVTEPDSTTELPELATKPETKVESIVEIVTEREPTVEPMPVTELAMTVNEAGNDIKSKTDLPQITTELHLDSSTEIFAQPESTVKPISDDDTSFEAATEISLLNDASATDTFKFLNPDLTNGNNDFKDDGSLTTTETEKPNENLINDDTPLQVIPLRSKNISTDVNVEVKTEATTMQTYISKDDGINESTTIEEGITSNYEDSKQNGGDNQMSIKSKNHEESNGEFIQIPNVQEDKKGDSTTEINLNADVNNVQNENSSINERRSSSGSDVPKQPDLITTAATTAMPDVLLKNKLEFTTGSTLNFHTIEINGISDRNPEKYNNPKVYETTVIPETTSTDAFTQPGHQEEHLPQPALPVSDTQDSNDRNVIEHMPTTVFPKVPKNFAHNVEPLKEPIAKSDDEYTMEISTSVEKHSLIPQLTPEQSVRITNVSLKAPNSTTEINNGVVNENLNASKYVQDKMSTASTERTVDENIRTVRPDEVQEDPFYSTTFTENSVDFTGKTDANDDRHTEDMSPYLPDVHKEKESAKKAPRLDKDEQDAPNSFETRIDDVTTHRPHINASDMRREVNETETKDLLNDVNLRSVSDEIDITKKLTENHKMNAVDDNSAKETTKNDLDVGEVPNDTEFKNQNVSRHNSSTKSYDSDVTEDNIYQRNNSSSEDNDKVSRVLPLEKDKSVDLITQTTMQFTDKKTSEVTTSPAEKKVEVRGSTVESGTISSKKPEENAVEDQYNDITDETLKGYRHDNTGKDIPIKIVEGSKKAISNDIDPIEVPYNGILSSTTVSNVMKERDGTNVEISSDTTQSPITTKVGSAVDNQTEDVRLTTQEPVLPIEIQQELSTTVATDKVEIATTIDDGRREENNTEQPNVGQPDERGADKIMQITTTQSTLETKTTAQVPILPEELQTTENDILITTSMTPNEEKEMKEEGVYKTGSQILTENVKGETKKTSENENTVAPTIETNIDSTSSERSMAATTVYENNVTLKSGPTMERDKNTNAQNGTMIESSTESMKIETILMMSTTEKNIERTTPMSNDAAVTTTEDVRPVTEVLDDTPIHYNITPINYSIYTMTIAPNPIIKPGVPDDESLTVIPLEKSQESKKKSVDKKGFDKYKYKKEKDLSLEDQSEDNVLAEVFSSTALPETESPKVITGNYEELKDSVVSPDIDPSVPRNTVLDRDGNVFPRSKGKNVKSNTENKGMETKFKSYPSFIPVSEEIMEPIPVTEPYVIRWNYTYRPTIVSDDLGAESTSEATVEDRAGDLETDLSRDAGVDKMIGQPVTPFPADQSFGDAEEAKVERVTKELFGNPLIARTTPLDYTVVGSTTTASSNSAPAGSPFSVLRKCTADQFQCANGTSRDSAYCVPLSAKCDSENDCSDGSDELNCEEAGCSGNFRCASGLCLKRHLVCNEIVDCDDGSDESNCESWKCQTDEFRCPNGRCIPEAWRCNGRPDCEEHSDEYNCTESCQNNEYLCPTEKWCIPQTWRCNGIAECVNGEDEKLCDCASGQFKCQTGGCVPLVEVCNGIENCPDHSDEWGCLIANITVNRNLTNTKTDINIASQLIHQAPLLKIRQQDGDYRLVCSDGWSKEFSDSYCRALGYAEAETTEMTESWDRSQKILRLKTNPNHRLPLVTNLEQVDSCVLDKVVRVSCQDFSCDLYYSEGETAKLADGILATERQWSSVALLKDLKRGTACTATILGPMHALASYSCVYRHNKNKWQLFTGGNMLKGQPIKNIVPYPQVKYNQFLYNNDIALIELEAPLVFSRNVSAVCLPKQPVKPRQTCMMAGWGFLTNGEIELRQYLKSLLVPIYDSDKCNATNHYAGFITEHDICAEFTETDKSPCYNDEGAPLICVSEPQDASKKWEIQGLLSHHSRCSKDHPAIYSSLEPALSWLRESVPALRTQS